MPWSPEASLYRNGNAIIGEILHPRCRLHGSVSIRHSYLLIIGVIFPRAWNSFLSDPDLLLSSFVFWVPFTEISSHLHLGAPTILIKIRWNARCRSLVHWVALATLRSRAILPVTVPCKLSQWEIYYTTLSVSREANRQMQPVFSARGIENQTDCIKTPLSSDFLNDLFIYSV